MKISANLHGEWYFTGLSSFKRFNICIILVALLLGLTIKSYSKNYYVKSKGDDNNTGLSDGQAWSTIAKVNASSFLPGDTIFFNKDDIWRETLIIPSSIWYSTLPITPFQVFINDIYVQPAHWPSVVGASPSDFQYPSGSSADATHLKDVDLSGIPEAYLIGAQVNIYTASKLFC